MDFSKRFPVAENLVSIVDYRVDAAQQRDGFQIPCTVVEVDNVKGLVTVNFEVENTPFNLPQITIPVMCWEYIRYPIQVGDPGVTISADTDLISISGGKSRQPDFSPSSNLNTVLMFAPIMNRNKFETPNPNATVIYGPDGVVLFDYSNEETHSTLIISQTMAKMVNGDSSIEISNGEVKVTGTLIINGEEYMAHTHSGVEPGAGNTGGVN
jgi:hypothetical protein